MSHDGGPLRERFHTDEAVFVRDVSCRHRISVAVTKREEFASCLSIIFEFERAVLLKPSKLRTTITFRPEGVGRCRLVCLKEDDFLYKNFASDYNLDGTFRVVSGCNG